MSPRPTIAQEVEQLLRNAVELGRQANFEADEWLERHGPKRPRIPAQLVRELVLGAGAPSGVQIKGARIAGPIDLVDARGPSGVACNALILENCELTGSARISPGIDASHSHLQRLSLSGCQTDGVELSSAVIVGDLILDGIRPRTDRGACWIKARGAHVGGWLTARRAKLSLPWRPPAEGAKAVPWPPEDAHHWANVRAPFALDLGGARIDGSLNLQPDFEAIGGVSLSGTTIGGDVWGQGATLSAARVGRDSIEALFAQSVVIGGFAMFGGRDPDSTEDRRFDARGTLSFYTAKIAGGLFLSGVRVTGGGAADLADTALSLYAASVGADVRLDEDDDRACEIPTVSLVMATIGGTLSVVGSPRTPVRRIDGAGVRVAGDLTLSGEISTTDLSGSVTNGALQLGPGFVLDGTRIGDPPSLLLGGASVGRNLMVYRIDRTTAAPRRVRAADLSSYPGWRLAEALFSSADRLELAVLAFLYRPDGGSNVVILTGVSDRIHDFNERRPPALETDVQVKEYLSLFCNFVWAKHGEFLIVKPPGKRPATDAIRDLQRVPDGSWRAVANVEYGPPPEGHDDAAPGRSVQFEAVFLIKASGELEMTDDNPIRVGPVRPIVVYDSPVRRVRARSSDQGSVDWPIPPPLLVGTSWFDVGAHVADSSVVQEALIREFGNPVIDIAGMKTVSLADNAFHNWDPSHRLQHAGPHLRLNLTGFEYDRIDPLPEPEQRSAAPSLARSKGSDEPKPDRIEWLKAHYSASGAEEYQPQPFEQLARVLRSTGDYGAADKVTFAKLEIERKLLSGWRMTRYLKWSIGAALTLSSVLLVLLALGVVPGEVFGSIIVVAFTASGLLFVPMRILKLIFLQWPFGYGLKTERALATFAVLWVIGASLVWAGSDGTAFWAGSDDVSERAVMKVDASAVSTVASSTTAGDPLVVQVVDVKGEPEIPCLGQIDPFVYTVDVMVPLLDLRQEQRCAVSADEGAWFWRLVKVFFAVAGWIVVSGIVVTASGVVRRHVER